MCLVEILIFHNHSLFSTISRESTASRRRKKTDSKGVALGTSSAPPRKTSTSNPQFGHSIPTYSTLYCIPAYVWTQNDLPAQYIGQGITKTHLEPIMAHRFTPLKSTEISLFSSWPRGKSTLDSLPLKSTEILPIRCCTSVNGDIFS